MQDLLQREAALLSDLCRETNGAVAASMTEKGLSYGLNYGVSITDIRRVCRLYAPDDRLARYIYTKDIRELRLAAYLIADPALFTTATAGFWAAGVTTIELASNGALSLFSKSPETGPVVTRWLQTGTPPLVMYAAVLTAAGNIMHTAADIRWDWRELLELISERVGDRVDDDSGRFVGEGIAALLLRLQTVPGVDAAAIKQFLRRVTAVRPRLGDYLETEVGWSLP